MSTIPPFSSLGRSVEAYQPYYAPPTYPQTNYIQGSSVLATVIPPVVTRGTTGAATVSSKSRTTGMNYLYSRGGQIKQWFRMKATGQVESTAAQPVTASTWFNMFNGALYAAGYPRNLGWSEKVPTIPPAALGIGPDQMAPRPQFRRNIYTQRSFSTAPSIPAKPQNGR